MRRRFLLAAVVLVAAVAAGVVYTQVNGSSDATLYATTELGTDSPEAVPLNDSRLADSAVVQSVVKEAVADDAAAVDLTAAETEAVKQDLDAVRNDTNARTGVYIRHDGTVVNVYVRVET